MCVFLSVVSGIKIKVLCKGALRPKREVPSQAALAVWAGRTPGKFNGSCYEDVRQSHQALGTLKRQENMNGIQFCGYL